MYCSGESKICVSHFEMRPLIKRQLSDLILLGRKHTKPWREEQSRVRHRLNPHLPSRGASESLLSPGRNTSDILRLAAEQTHRVRCIKHLYTDRNTLEFQSIPESFGIGN